MKNKVIIWGYKLHTHTHSYVHNGYYKAFKKMGYKTYWFGDNDDVSNFNFDNCIFFATGLQENKIPINKTSFYILHHIKDISKYINNNLNYINLGNYLSCCDDGISANHIENSVVKINECCFWDEKTRTIYQPWATDLTPDEINLDSAMKFNPNETNINFIGTSHDNDYNINLFKSSLPSDKKLNILGGISDEENMRLIRNSLISIDVRCPSHIERGYIPCRIFKNISYGRLTGTNSEHVKKVFGDYVVYEENPILLYNKMINAEEITQLSKIKESMDYVKNNHTYINRIMNILKIK